MEFGHKNTPDRVGMNWLMIGASVRGAAHIRSNLPNQDAIGWLCVNDEIANFMAVADGHGSRLCFRSDKGSKFAVDTFLMEARAFINRVSLYNYRLAGSVLSCKLPLLIKQKWDVSVAQHMKKNPFTEYELSALEQKERDKVETNPFLAYGSTLLGVVITQKFIFFLQIGDGDILYVETDGKTKFAVDKDPNMLGNETNSLCQEDAIKYFRHATISSDFAPELILLSTDGYNNSFVDQQGFLSIGVDYLNMINESGLAAVASQMPAFLNETSSYGSGDDISLGLIRCVIPEISNMHKQEEKSLLNSTVELEEQ